MGVRKAILAGSWYPGQAAECEREIGTFMKDSNIHRMSGQKVIGGTVPHAGWYFSGSIACNVIHHLVDEDPPDSIVLFGMHLHSNAPNYIMKEGFWETPFGDIRIEETLTDALIRAFPFIVETADDFIEDNTIEIQLPFIKYFFKDVSIVPIGVPPRSSSLEIGIAAVNIANEIGMKIRIIGSTDLTHYGRNYGFSPKGAGRSAVDWARRTNDRTIIDRMTEMDPEAVIETAQAQQNACCSGAAATAIAAVKQLGAKTAKTIAYANSFDKQPGDSFVGYAGIVYV